MELTILFTGFFILLLLGVPITFAMAIPSALVMLVSPNIPALIISQKIFSTCDSFTLMAMPFFMLAGGIMDEAGITKKIVLFGDSLVGHIRGGLAHTTSLAGMIMAGVSGSANADASALGALLVPSLKKAGYDEGFSVSLVASCGVLGVIIPPSILMVVYAGVTSISISKLFMAGIIPGIMCGVFYMVYSYIYACRKQMPRRKFSGLKRVWETFKQAIWALIMPIIIIGSILGGICTATEAGMIAVLYGIFYGFITKSLTIKNLISRALSAAKATAMSMSMIAFACLFGYIMTRMNFPDAVNTFMSTYISNKYGVLFFIMIILLFMGMFVDSNASMLMMVPIFAPLIATYGFDPIYFAMVILLSLVNGGLTPPVGLVLYIVCSVDNTPVSKAARAVWVFVGINILVLILVIFIPKLVTFMPGLLG